MDTPEHTSEDTPEFRYAAHRSIHRSRRAAVPRRCWATLPATVEGDASDRRADRQFVHRHRFSAGASLDEVLRSLTMISSNSPRKFVLYLKAGALCSSVLKTSRFALFSEC